jgi:hypothetical protein
MEQILKKLYINDSTINILSRMTSLTSLTCALISELECSNWKQLLSLKSLRSLNVSMINEQSQLDFLTMLPSLSSLRSLELHYFVTSAIPSGYLWPPSLESVTMNGILDQCSLIHRMAKGDISIPPNLTNLQLDENQDEYGTNSAIAIALQHLPHLRSLRLPRCSIDPSLLPPATQLLSLTLLDVLCIDTVVTWINELPSLSELHLSRWDGSTAQQLRCRHLTAFHSGPDCHSRSLRSILVRHKQLQQLSASSYSWSDFEAGYLPSLTSLLFTCGVAYPLDEEFIPQLASTSLCELSLSNTLIPIESWNLMRSLIWPNLKMMDITRTHNMQHERPLEWMTAAMDAIDKMDHVRQITLIDELRPDSDETYDNMDDIICTTSTFIRMIASISHVMHLHLSQLHSHNGEAVRNRGGILSFSLYRI